MLINPSLQHQSEILAFPWGSDSLSKLDAELYIHRTCLQLLKLHNWSSLAILRINLSQHLALCSRRLQRLIVYGLERTLQQSIHNHDDAKIGLKSRAITENSTRVII